MGGKISSGNIAVGPYPHYLTPSVSPGQEKRRLVTTNGPEGAPGPIAGPIAVNRLPSDTPSPPPYTARK
jgi:hypothetical protein